jgi:hypothetical protein
MIAELVTIVVLLPSAFIILLILSEYMKWTIQTEI